MSKIETLADILVECQYCSTITQVAQKLYVSQPYVSQILQSTESKYNVTLVARSKNPIQLTPAGSHMLKHLTRLINEKNLLNDEMSWYAKNRNNITSITFNQPLATLMGAEIFTKLRAEFPNTIFYNNEQTTYVALRSLLEDKTDIFIGSALTNKEIITLPITKNESPLILIPKANSLYSKVSSNIDLNKNLSLFENCNFIGLSGRSYFQDIINQLFTDNNIHINTTIFVPNTIAATLTALHGSEIAITLPFVLPRLQIPQSKYKLIPIPQNLFNASFGISYRRNCNSTIKSIVNTLKNLIIKFYNQKD
ncbi:LysR family transcriptional regulator [Lactobacillus sp. ESL0791]|uniref:LysR family transcriptional regulator n=1 Tax=Lactobacillus sp. ESL0791 TaxID=2983234 RepID=UPI0023F627B1|nr:LysR family transcriptional regulator [Lactobacillus sp. ESL0791]MDF7639712.1 LysR family transcriptional regulator [Lactobacillus sp. ESL0791]